VNDIGEVVYLHGRASEVGVVVRAFEQPSGHPRYPIAMREVRLTDGSTVIAPAHALRSLDELIETTERALDAQLAARARLEIALDVPPRG
jgi:hypothetical protein